MELMNSQQIQGANIALLSVKTLVVVLQRYAEQHGDEGAVRAYEILMGFIDRPLEEFGGLVEDPYAKNT